MKVPEEFKHICLVAGVEKEEELAMHRKFSRILEINLCDFFISCLESVSV